MSYFRTAILLAVMTALFMGIGFMIGGQGGMIIAFLVAAGMNLFSDSIIALRMDDGSMQVLDSRGPSVGVGARVEITPERYIRYPVS